MPTSNTFEALNKVEDCNDSDRKEDNTKESTKDQVNKSFVKTES